MKAYFVLAQCLLAMQDVDGALENAMVAHRLGSEANDKSLAQLTNLVLRCKKERWDRRERQRVRDGQELEEQLVFLMEREKSDNLALCESEIERAEVTEECNRKIGLLRATFEASRSAAEKKREVPDWVIDDISFGIMVDPVIVGFSFSFSSFFHALHSILFLHGYQLQTNDHNRPRLESRMKELLSWRLYEDIKLTL